MSTMPLKEVDTVEILTVLDNTIDMLLPDSEKAKRPPGLLRWQNILENQFMPSWGRWLS